MFPDSFFSNLMAFTAPFRFAIVLLKNLPAMVIGTLKPQFRGIDSI